MADENNQDGTVDPSQENAQESAAAVDNTKEAPKVPSTEELMAAYTNLATVVASLKKEVGDVNRNVRKANPNPKDKQTVQWSSDDRLNFRDSIELSGINVTPKQRQALERLAVAEGVDTTDTEWVKTTFSTFWGGNSSSSTTQQEKTAPLKTPAPTGSGTGRAVIPENPEELTQAHKDAMTPAQIAAHKKAWADKHNPNRNPFGSGSAAPRKPKQ